MFVVAKTTIPTATTMNQGFNQRLLTEWILVALRRIRHSAGKLN